MSRKQRKLRFIRLKNACQRKTARLDIPWHTDQIRFQFGIATVRIPSDYKQQCLTLVILTRQYEQQHKLLMARRTLKSMTLDLPHIQKELGQNKQTTGISTLMIDIIASKPTRNGLHVTLVTENDSRDIQHIEEIIDNCYPTLLEHLVHLK